MKPFPNIATAVAVSPNLEANICESIRIKEKLGERLYLIHVEQGETDERAEILKALENSGCSLSDVSVIWESGDDPVEAILRVTKQKHVDLLVAGALPREGLLRYYRGSIARQLVRKSNCSILLMTKPKRFSQPCNHVVVNGREHPKTPSTIKKALEVCENLGASQLSVVEEVNAPRKLRRADDDEQATALTEKRAELQNREETRIHKLLQGIPNSGSVRIDTKVILGKKGYTIGHYTQSLRADLLVLNSPDTKLGFIDRVFTHDLEYILSELPSDILIVHSRREADEG